MSVILYSKERWGVCKCEHYDWQHSDFVYGGEDGFDIIAKPEGHGKCGFEDCDCEQFTWVGSVPSWKNQSSTPKSSQDRAPIVNVEGGSVLRHDHCRHEDEDGDCSYDGICRHKDKNWKCQATDDDLMTHAEYLQTLHNSKRAQEAKT